MEGNSCVWQPQKSIAVFPMRFKENSDVIIATAFFQVCGWYRNICNYILLIVLALKLVSSTTILRMTELFLLFLQYYFFSCRNLWMWGVLKNGPKHLLAPGHPFLLQNWEENLLKIWAQMEDLSLLVTSSQPQ